MLKSELKEFVNIQSLNKFSRHSEICFSNGKRTYNWFSKNKKEILNSDEEDCKLIQIQFEEYNNFIKEDSKRIKEGIFLITKTSEILLKEFINIQNIHKFDKDSNIFLSNGMTTYEWFLNNANAIFAEDNELLKQVKGQYFQAKKNKKIINASKDKYYFYKEKDLYKFNEFSTIELPSKRKSGIWFLQNKEVILSSNNPIDLEIAKQYHSYGIYYALVLEFYYQNDFMKFNETSNIRFKSGALMSEWWEVNKEYVLSSDFFLSVLIKKQYEEYVKNILGTQKGRL